MRTDLIQAVFDSGRAGAAQEIQVEFNKYEARIAVLQMENADLQGQLLAALAAQLPPPPAEVPVVPKEQ